MLYSSVISRMVFLFGSQITGKRAIKITSINIVKYVWLKKPLNKHVYELIGRASIIIINFKLGKSYDSAACFNTSTSLDTNLTPNAMSPPILTRHWA